MQEGNRCDPFRSELTFSIRKLEGFLHHSLTSPIDVRAWVLACEVYREKKNLSFAFFQTVPRRCHGTPHVFTSPDRLIPKLKQAQTEDRGQRMKRLSRRMRNIFVRNSGSERKMTLSLPFSFYSSASQYVDRISVCHARQESQSQTSPPFSERHDYRTDSTFDQIVAIGRNYAAHIKELNNATPTEPFFFLKPTSAYALSREGAVEIPRGVVVHHEGESSFSRITGTRSLFR